MIADYFFKNNIRYEYERPAWGNGWTYGNRIIGRPDFYLLDFDVYVEYWGMLDADDPNDRQEYVRGMKWKMAKYHENGIKFISIYPRNLGNLDRVFRTKLRDGTGIEFG